MIYDPLTETADTDVAVVGGGYTGLSCAAHLARPLLVRLAYQEWFRRWAEESARGLFGEWLEALGTVRDLIRERDIDAAS